MNELPQNQKDGLLALPTPWSSSTPEQRGSALRALITSNSHCGLRFLHLSPQHLLAIIHQYQWGIERQEGTATLRGHKV